MYKGTLIAVRDMEESKRFYRDIMGMEVEGDFGANVQLEGGLFLQTLETWSRFICGKDVCLKNNAAELYFEVSDIDAFYKKLQTAGIEDMPVVVKRFLRGGMTVEQAAQRMDVPVDYIQKCAGRD